jgi:urease accessory protein
VKANLHIQVKQRNGVSGLANCYFSPPFKVMNITEDKLNNPLHLILMSSSPGILDEDDYELKIDIEENCALQLHTQSYQRLFNMTKGARQLTEVNLQTGASFIYLPHPAVPHENSIFTSANKIFLSNHCNLAWSEILTCGRKLTGEVFQFSKYHNCTQVFIDNKLIIKENLLVQPSLVHPDLTGQMEGFTHQASLIFLNEALPVNEVSNTVYDFLSLQGEITFGVSTAPVNGLLVRILGYKAEQLYDCIKAIAALISDEVTKIDHLKIPT